MALTCGRGRAEGAKFDAARLWSADFWDLKGFLKKMRSAALGYWGLITCGVNLFFPPPKALSRRREARQAAIFETADSDLLIFWH